MKISKDDLFYGLASLVIVFCAVFGLWQAFEKNQQNSIERQEQQQKQYTLITPFGDYIVTNVSTNGDRVVALYNGQIIKSQGNWTLIEFKEDNK